MDLRTRLLVTLALAVPCTAEVPVNTSIPVGPQSLPTGATLNLPCDVEGFPLPDVFWTKDGARLAPDARTQLTDARLTLSRLAAADSGEYGCHARNEYGAHSSSVRVTVQDVSIPVHCTDNPLFANCQLIVRSKFCRHQYYSNFCCKSCLEAGQLNPLELTTRVKESWEIEDGK